MHKEEIESEDIDNMYSSLAFNIDTPSGLLNKVWFELCLYYCRRGRENQRDMSPANFEI